MKKIFLPLTLLMAQDTFGTASGGGWNPPAPAPIPAPVLQALTAQAGDTVTITDVPDVPTDAHLTPASVQTLTATPPVIRELLSNTDASGLKAVLKSVLLGNTDPASAKAALSAEIVKIVDFTEGEITAHLPAMSRVIVPQFLKSTQGQEKQVADAIAARIVDAICN